jgi:hypothetical protein
MAHNKSFEAPAGKWIPVPQGMVIAPGTYVDDEGYLRFASNESYAVWHRNIGGKQCSRFTQVDEDGVIVPIGKDEILVVEGVPWCIYCMKVVVPESE